LTVQDLVTMVKGRKSMLVLRHAVLRTVMLPAPLGQWYRGMAVSATMVHHGKPEMIVSLVILRPCVNLSEVQCFLDSVTAMVKCGEARGI
jgi:hypothetical protein